MSRRRKASRGSRFAIAALAVIVIALGALLWRIWPEYQRLRKAQGKGGRAAVTQGNGDRNEAGSRPVVADLYFARVVDGKQRMVAITRELPPGLGVARACLEELLRGEVPRGCDRPLPPGTELRGITLDGGVATVDFSEQLQSGFRGGSDNEGVVIYSIVNTLTSLPTIERVQILVEGQHINTIGGHLDISGPLEFDGELVAPHS